MPTALDLITSSLRLLEILPSGEAPTGDEATDGLATLNQMLDSWNTERLSIFTISAASYPLTGGKQLYTIGGPGFGADIDATRPIKIENANIILTVNTPNIHLPLTIINDDEFSQITAREIPGTIPRVLYNDGAFPLSTLFLWGQPLDNSLKLELFTWQQLSQVPDLTTVLSFPPGYLKALRFNLALDLAAEYGMEAIQKAQALAPLAIQAKANIQGMNTPDPVMIADPACLGTNRLTLPARFLEIFYGKT